MKKLYILLVTGLMALTAQAQIINIPDANFKAKLLAASSTNTIASNSANVYIKVDANNDNEIDVSEALQVAGLNVSIAEIYDLTGIASFTNLRMLNCSQNHIPSLDVSNLVNLRSLYCSLNLLPTLDLSGLTHLLTLECAENLLTQIDFADATNLQSLSCRFNLLTTLAATGLTSLHSLNCDYNQLTTLDVSTLTQLTDLGCQSNQFQALDFSSLLNLTALNCSFNQLTALDLSGLDGIATLNCAHNQIAALDVSNLTQLSVLNCEFNQIGNPFVLNGMSELQSVYCQNNLIPSFAFSDLPSLQILDCSTNQISTLDVSQLPSLSLLNCYSNPLLTSLNIHNGSIESFLDFSNNANLHYVCADDAQLTTVQNLITQYGYTNCEVNALCDLGVPDLDFVFAFSVSPVPAKNVLNITTKQTVAISSASIYNTLGQLVQLITNPTETIDVSSLKTGTYFITIVSDKGTTSSKFIKE